MNWYKRAITESEFYDFYGYSSLDFDSLKDNPKLLYDMIDHINYIREYYLQHLIGKIAMEIYHGEHHIVALKGEYGMGDDERKIVDEKISKLFERFMNNSIDSLTIKDFGEAYNIFNNFEWTDVFGGKLWAEIVRWTQKLWQAGKIELRKYDENLFNNMYRAIMAIDTINSLEHNTNSVLIDLPNQEYVWIKKALDLVKNVKKSYNLVSLLENIRLKEHIMKNRMMAGEKYDPKINNAYRDFFESYFEKFKKHRYYNAGEYLSLSSRLVKLEPDQIRVFLSVVLENLSEMNEFSSEAKPFYQELFDKLAFNKSILSDIKLVKDILYIIEKTDCDICSFVRKLLVNLTVTHPHHPHIIQKEVAKYILDWVNSNYCSEVLMPEDKKNILVDILNEGD